MSAVSRARQPRYSAGRGHRRVSRRKRAKPGVPSAARRRGPAPVLVITALIAAVVLCWVFGRGCGTSREARENERLREYASAVSKLIERSSAVGVQFENLRGELKDLPGAEVDRKLAQMVSDCGEIVEGVAEVETPPMAEDLQPVLRVGMEMRAGGLEKFRVGIMEVLAGKDREEAAATISESMMDLVVSDETVQRFRSGLENKLKAAKSGDLGFPSVSESTPFVPRREDALLSGVTRYISELGGEEAGEVVRGVAVTSLTTSPTRKDRTGSGVDILPFSRTFTVSVAVENQGNQEEEDLPVVVTFAPGDGSEPEEQTKKIARLKPKESVTLVFEGFEPALGRDRSNSVKVMAGPVPDEKNLENNSMELDFLMDRQSG